MLLKAIVRSTFEHMDELYGKALAILAKDETPLDLAMCQPNALAKRLRTLGVAHACITCFEQFNLEDGVKAHLRQDTSHIYPKHFLEEERRQVLLLMKDDKEGSLKVKIVFALKKSLLVHVFN